MSEFVAAVKVLINPLKRSLLHYIGSFDSMSEVELEAYRHVLESIAQDIEEYRRIKKELKKVNL